MANERRVEQKLKIGGKEYTFRLDYNDIAEAEADLGSSALDLFTTGRTVQLREVRGFFFRGVQGQHGVVTERDAGNLLGQHSGVFQTVCNAIALAVNELFAEETDAEGN